MPLPAVKRLQLLVAAALLGLAGVAGWWLPNRGPTLDQIREQAEAALMDRDWAKLAELSHQWTARMPQEATGWLYQAEALQQQGQYAEAVACLQKIPDTDPRATQARLGEIDLQFGPMNRPRVGAEVCERLLKVNPASPAARQRLTFFLAMTLQRTRLIREIRSSLDRAEVREAYVYLFLADVLHFSNGAELNGQWLQGEPDSELYEVAQAMFIAEALDASISMDDREAAQLAQLATAKKGPLLDKLLKKYPHNVELLAYQLKQCLLTGKVDRAVELLAQAPAEAEQDNRFWRYKGWVHAQWDEAQAAEDEYRQALKLHPLDWSTRHLLADLLQQQGRPAEAKAQRDLVNRANALRRVIQGARNAREMPTEALQQLAHYARDCGDTQFAAALGKQLARFSGRKGAP